MSYKPVAQKLLIKEKDTVLLINEPKNYRPILGTLPASVTVTSAAACAELIQVFVTSKKELEEYLPKLKTQLSKKGLLWVTYPKGSSKVKTDVNRDKIAAYAKTVGLQAVAMISIDDTWSALRVKLS